MGCGPSRTKKEEKKKDNAKVKQVKPIVIFVLGGPGSGKGTQCTKLVQDFKFVHLSTGDLLRDEVKNKGSHSAEIEGVLKEGKLVTSDMLVKLINTAVEKHGFKSKFLLDGFPRSHENVEAWDSLMKDIVQVPFLLYFTCSEPTMEKRLIKRGETSGRSDDNSETIRKRFNTFKTETEPVIIEMKKRKTDVVEISAEGEVDDVYKKLKEAIISSALDS